MGPDPLPDRVAPMKAVSSPELPPAADPVWSYEVKWDGMRALAFVDGDRARVQSSNLLDVTAAWPELSDLPAALGVRQALLDGELVATDDEGRPSFGRLQQRMHVASPAEARRRAGDVPVSYVVFDLLHLDGHDLTALPLEQRRDVLGGVVEPGPRWRCSPVYDDGAALLAAATEQGLEGIMAKRSDSRYEPGARSRAWRKVKVRRRQELVVGGWVPGEGGRAGRIGALLVGVHDEQGRLRYAGRVGTGFTSDELDRLAQRFAPRAAEVCPFDPPPPRSVARVARWLRPELVAEVAFGEWTSEGILRHPSYLGLRTDKDPAEVVREH